VTREITVSATPNADGWTCQVTIQEGGRAVSVHVVEATRRELERFAPESSVEDLVRRSFKFLLEREPPQSILRRFGLSDIEHYYPQYPRVIRA
jgi:hypothetical protein